MKLIFYLGFFALKFEDFKFQPFTSKKIEYVLILFYFSFTFQHFTRNRISILSSVHAQSQSRYGRKKKKEIKCEKSPDNSQPFSIFCPSLARNHGNNASRAQSMALCIYSYILSRYQVAA